MEIARRSAVIRRVLGSTCVAAMISLCAVPETALTLPVGEQVVAGQAKIQRPNSSNLTIQQKTPQVIINWGNFSIAARESVVFQQPSASSVALNRVTGQQPSEIFGRLSANGHLFLINPNGVLFGPTASVDVGSIVASTLSLSNENFL